ncbi:MAG TPA: dihydroorotate dehydrogenase electron transfer subunit [Blastocatellia bacterium]|nr:dihydroorotate dehydrogenase electron transfer subunit [Blastocatellia bacterium]
MIETRATVVSNDPEGQNYWRLRLSLKIPLRPQPGQFAMLRPSDQIEPILRRAFVFYRVKERDTGTDCEFIYKIVGRGTQQLRRARPGDTIDFLGPLGRGFHFETLTPSTGEVYLVSGGVGLPALYMLAEELSLRGIHVKLFHGEATARPEMEPAGLSDFTLLLGREAIVCTTEDGSFGRRGLVTEPLEEELRQGATCPARIFACGPSAMLREITRLSREFRVPAEISVEAAMGCGFGVCLGCVVPVRDCTTHRVTFKRVCIEGPVFSADELAWEDLPASAS